jgi:hypothetical protein
VVIETSHVEEANVPLALFAVCMVYFLLFPQWPYAELLVEVVVGKIARSEALIGTRNM